MQTSVDTKQVRLRINLFAAVLKSYLVMHNLVAVCPSAEYTRHTAHSSNA